MRYFFIFLNCLAAYAMAEKCSFVEYQLSQAKTWNVVFEGPVDDLSNYIGYSPDNVTDSNFEHFGVQHNKYSIDLDQFSPEELTIIEKDESSVLFQFSVETDGKVVCGLWRIFSKGNESVILIYLTNKIDQFDQLSTCWIQTLKEAKAINESF